jgi:hypothetical protein
MIDFDSLLNVPVLAIFGEAADQRPTYTPAAGGVPAPFDAAFDDAYMALVIQADGEPDIASVEPILGVRLAQFAAGHPEQGGVVTVPRVGKTYRIANAEPDGKGWALLRLQLEAP